MIKQNSQEIGVHQASRLHYRSEKYPGKSHASFQKPGMNKLIHRQKLQELKGMPLPKLP